MSTASPVHAPASAPTSATGDPPDPVSRLRRIVEVGSVATTGTASGSEPEPESGAGTGARRPPFDAADDGERPELPAGRVAELPEWAPSRSGRAALLGGLSLGRAGGMALLAAVLVVAGFALANLLRSEPSEVSAPDLPGLSAAGGAGDPAGAAAPTVSAAASASGASAGAASGFPPPGAGESVGTVVVSVVGLVVRPGLVTLGPSPRVADALAAAGGALPEADTTSLNLAQILEDGEQVVVGVRALEAAAPPGSQLLGAGGAAAGVIAPGGAASGAGAGAPGKADGKVNLNSATAAELEGLNGVGPATSGAIIEYRESHGPFTDVEQLGEVRGIGPAKLAALRDAVTV